ncbi:MAG: FIST N-terminal domain-containing protein [Myxococcota bacterium]
MRPFIGVGKSNRRDPREAGREAAGMAVAGAPPDGIGLVLVHSTVGYEQGALLDGVVDVTGKAPLSGCSSSGVITRAGSDESDHAVAVMVMGSDRLRFETVQVGAFSEDPQRCGRDLAQRLARSLQRTRADEHRVLMIFPDGTAGNVRELLRNLEGTLQVPLLMAGGTAGEMLQMGPTYQFHDGRVASNAVSAVLITGDFLPEVSVNQCCDPVGIEHTITRAKDCWVLEIDDKPAWETYREYLDTQDASSLTMSDFCYISLAERLDEPDPEYGEFLVRSPLKADPATGALFFPADIRTGARVRVALRRPEEVVARSLACARNMLARHPSRHPDVVLQFNCSFRAGLLFGRHTTERSITPLQREFGDDVAWFGFNSYGEIAPLAHGPTRIHNYSAVLCALYVEPGGSVGC